MCGLVGVEKLHIIMLRRVGEVEGEVEGEAEGGGAT